MTLIQSSKRREVTGPIRCPECGNRATIVVDSRSAFNNEVGTRRRECTCCKYRFRTYEILATKFSTPKKMVQEHIIPTLMKDLAIIFGSTLSELDNKIQRLLDEKYFSQ